MKLGVKILPRKEVLDTQGRAVENILKNNGHEVDGCRVGKYVVLEVKANSKEDGKNKAEEMAKNLLCNSLIETFEIEEL